jgi:hypothetical protein
MQKIKYEKLDGLTRLLLKLNRFSCLLEYETGGNALCKELTPQDLLYSEYADKLNKAVLHENFYDLEVSLVPTSIFKLENRILTRNFQQLVSKGSREVKVFCVIATLIN